MKKNLKKTMVALGSKTARAGFKNEKDIVKKFKNWKKDTDAQAWLGIMSYKLSEIEKVDAVILHGHKTDVQVKITIHLQNAISAENLSIKLVSNPSGFNQVDKRWVDSYVQMWKIPNDVVKILKAFTGETKPVITKGLKDKRRVLLSEMDTSSQQKILHFFADNKILIVSDILKGGLPFPAAWMMVALTLNKKTAWTLKPINYVMNHFGGGDVRITDKGSLKIGRIGMQRKGGDGGRDTANMLQFKINPVELFEE
jgi:hypothetical protein